MKFSLIIPTYNNLQYLKNFIHSIKINSHYKHQIIIHVNEGKDGTLEYLKKENIEFTYSKENIGLCDAVNAASLKSTENYIIYTHDDMFFCNNWDIELEKDINNLNTKYFYISGMNISNRGGGYIDYDCGDNPTNFDEKKFNEFCLNDNTCDLQGSHWAPHIVHKDLWTLVGGFSPEFNPGDGSDPDFCLKLWNANVRIFKALSKFKVYHFGSVTIRKNKNIIKNNGTKKFILKWGFSPRFFRKYYLKGENHNVYNGPLTKPLYSTQMLLNLIINKLKFLYYKVTF